MPYGTQSTSQYQQQQHITNPQMQDDDEEPEFEPVSSSVAKSKGPSIGTNLRVLGVKTVGDYDTFLKHLPDHVELTFYDDAKPTYQESC
ncbi:hypothetical protein BGZ74_000797 [Mortierella antarctica]|nr:hypothetical protein BGZ74_000797 [Mortierella antarctica]